MVFVWFSGVRNYPPAPAFVPVQHGVVIHPSNADDVMHCPYCKAVFVARQALEDHVSKCATKKEICSYCQKRYKDVRDLRKHLKSKHGIE